MTDSGVTERVTRPTAAAMFRGEGYRSDGGGDGDGDDGGDGVGDGGPIAMVVVVVVTVIQRSRTTHHHRRQRDCRPQIQVFVPLPRSVPPFSLTFFALVCDAAGPFIHSFHPSMNSNLIPLI